MTDIHLRQPNDNNREVMIHRSVHTYAGEGCSSILNDEQLPGFVARVDSWMARGFTAPAALEIVGLRGAAAAQVLEAMEAE